MALIIRMLLGGGVTYDAGLGVSQVIVRKLSEMSVASQKRYSQIKKESCTSHIVKSIY